MKILFVTDALAPLSGSGAAAQVCNALPKALKSLDHQPFVLSPLYRAIDPQEHSLARRLTKLKHSFGGAEWSCELWTGRTIGGCELVFIGQEELFHAVDAIDAGDEREIAMRTGAFIRSALTLLQKNEQDWEVIHAHGWLGAAVIAAAKAAGIDLRAVLTVHDPADVYCFNAENAETLGLGAIDGSVNPLLLGLQAADDVTVVSRSANLNEIGYTGKTNTIRSGVDGATWNPLTDPELPARFDPVDLTAKAICKSALQKELGFPTRKDVPLVVALGCEGESDGLDLLAKAASQLLRNDVQLAVCIEGTAPEQLTGVFEELAERWPDRCQIRAELDSSQYHRATGGADLLLLPARRSSSAERVLIAQRYALVPIARREGAFGEAIVDCDAKLKTGSGFLFDEASPESMLAGAQRAIAAFAQENEFDGLRRRVMRLDASWDRSARIYDRLYSGPSED